LCRVNYNYSEKASMKFLKYLLVVLLMITASATILWGDDEKGAGSAPRWGLWSDPQGQVVQPIAEKAAPVTILQSEVEEPVATEYLIGPGDLLDIYVWKDEALTRTVMVLPDGKISFPLVGEMIASGKTVAQLKKEMEAKLVRFLPEPVLTVEVKQVNSQMVFVIGRVNAPGRFMLNSTVTVLQALALAGGCNPFADKSKIKIIRNEGAKNRIYRFDYDEVVKYERLEENISLKRGDVIVVP
jgi:polysaccharide export outer membrane protein